jgi:hypothetical protein
MSRSNKRGIGGLFYGGWIQRQAAALWMNFLILGALAIAFFTVWGGYHAEATKDEVALTALKAFAVWALAFLPGWLYIRFLGQRAGALMSEYVLNLHRLGWDAPQYLPEPLETSPFYDEWRKAGGPNHAGNHNIYLQKFDAYYGRSTTSGLAARRGETNFMVRVDTLFPVFVMTATLAAGWIAVLWDTTFIDGATSAADVLKYAFLGAYAFIAQDLVRRFFQSDLRPSAYASALLRIAFVLITMAATLQLIGTLSPEVQATVAFVVGVFPLVALQALQRAASRVLQTVVPQVTPRYPLSDLDGVNIWYEARLVEEGIEDMQNLATANLVDVILHTRVPVGRLVDWLDQAYLALHLPPRQDAPDKDARDDGSVTRSSLEARGIRTASDLLKAWPAALPSAGNGPARAHGSLRNRGIPGLDAEYCELLVRVLDEDVRLAPIWNWQARGVVAQEERRRPSSARAA